MKHTIQLTQASTWLLGLLMARPGWTKTEGDAYRASKIIMLLPDLDAPDIVESAPNQLAAHKAAKAWCTAPVVIVLTDRQRDNVKSCLKETISKNSLTNGPWTLQLLGAFGLEPDDDRSDEPFSPSPVATA